MEIPRGGPDPSCFFFLPIPYCFPNFCPAPRSGTGLSANPDEEVLEAWALSVKLPVDGDDDELSENSKSAPLSTLPRA